MVNSFRKVALVLLAGSALSLSACESSGGMRLGGIGAGTGSGATGDAGGTSDTGSGSSGTGVGGSGSGSAGTGGGAGSGSGGTGSGSGTGTGGGTSNQRAQGLADPVLVTAGNAVLATNDVVGGVTNGVDQALPITTPVTGTIRRVLRDTGQALVDAGQGRQFLVDGVLGAVGDAVTITAANNPVLASADGQPGAIGLAALSTNPATGTIAAVNALPTDGSGGLASVTAPALAGVLNGAQGALANPAGMATAAVGGAVNAANNVLGTATGAVNGVLANPTGAVNGVAQVAAGNAVLGTGPAAVGVGIAPASPVTGTVAAVNVLPAGGGQVASVTAPAAAPITNAVNGTVGAVTAPVAGAVGNALGGATSVLQTTAGNTTVGGPNAAIGVGVVPGAPVGGTVASANVAPGGGTTPAATVSLPVVGGLLPR